MNHKDNLSRIRGELRQGELESAMKLLEGWLVQLPGEIQSMIIDISDQLIHLRSQFSQIRKREKLRMISVPDFLIISNQIANSLIEICREVEELLNQLLPDSGAKVACLLIYQKKDEAKIREIKEYLNDKFSLEFMPL